eukprot:1147972-Pelagomonas_calceolata.AAC.5
MHKGALFSTSAQHAKAQCARATKKMSKSSFKKYHAHFKAVSTSHGGCSEESHTCKARTTTNPANMIMRTVGVEVASAERSSDLTRMPVRTYTEACMHRLKGGG